MKPFPQAAKAARHLAQVDPRLAPIIKAVGPMKIERDAQQSVFDALTRSIIYQQLHGKAAATIHGRFNEACGIGGNPPRPTDVLLTPEAKMRAAGLSQGKMRAILDLASRVNDGLLPTRQQAEDMADDALIEALTTVRGVGPWTAQMLLIFTLARPDVLPVDDYGVRKGFAMVYGKKKLPSPKALAKHGEIWRPYRSMAAWYFWRALEMEQFRGVKVKA